MGQLFAVAFHRCLRTADVLLALAGSTRLLGTYPLFYPLFIFFCSFPFFSQDNIVWPAYLKAHRPLFLAGDVEQGSIDSSVIEGVELLEARNIDMGEMVRLSCERIYGNMLSGHRASDWKKP